MPSIFPSLCAFRGVGGLLGKLKAKTLKDEPPRDMTINELNMGYSRMVDTFIYNYPQLVRDNSAPFARVRDPSVKVAIIGAGFAGATATYELRRAGIKNITVYEARRQENGAPLVGGRAYSPAFQSKNRDYVNEMGPMRVPENSKLFWHYFSKVLQQNSGEPNELQKLFPNPGVVATQLIFRGLKYSWKGSGNAPQPEEESSPDNVDWVQLQKDIFGYEEPGEEVEGFIDSLVYNSDDVDSIGTLLVKETLTSDEVEQITNYWKHFLPIYNDVPFIKALEDYFGERWGEQEYNMFATLGLGTGGFGPLFPTCFLEIFRLLLWQYEQEYSPSMRIADIVDKLLNYNHNDDCQINLINETVDYIGINKDDPNKVKVYSIKGEEEVCSLEYDYVIVATTLRSMQARMNLDAVVPPRDYSDGSKAVFETETNIRESMRIPHIMNSSKLFGLIDPKPWSINGGLTDWPFYTDDMGQKEPIKCVLTDTLARQMYFLDPYPDENDAASNVLISYNWGDDSTKIMAIRNYESYQTIYPSNSSDFVLKKAYQSGLEGSDEDSPIAAALDSICEDNLASVIWQEEPMIYGAFKIDYPNQYYATSQLVYQYQQPDKRVYLAGNNCSFAGGWIEGAMQSAVNASAAVLRHVEQKGEAKDFRMEALFVSNPFQNVLNELKNEHAGFC